MWLALAVGLIALPFLSLPGRYVFDTRDLLWFNPGAYLSHALELWRQNPYMGLEQHDGIAVPMGIAVWLLRSIGLSPWAAERVWHGVLLFVAVGTMMLLVDEVRGRRTPVGGVTAGLLYGLSPYAFAYGLQFTAVFLPYVLLPLLLLVTHRGIARRGLMWPALFGLTTFLMGGGNGAPQVYVILTAIALMAWMTFVERAVRFGQAVRFAIWSGIFTIGLNAYWLFLLGSSEVGNALAFTEQPVVINVASTAAETIRGLGFWQFYGGDQYGPWIPVARSYITAPLAMVAGFAVPVGALLSAWLVRWRYRVFFLLLSAVSLVVAMGIFPVSHSTPFGRLLLEAYARVPGAQGLRTTYKLITTLNLSLAVLAGVGVQAVWDRARWAGRRRWTRVGAVSVVALIVATAAMPLLEGRVYNRAHGTGSLPTYWQDALATLESRDTTSRALFMPSTGWAIYRWGAIKEAVPATDPTLPAINPIRLPIGQRYGSNLLAALERPYFRDLPAEGTAQLLRYLGVKDLVLQNDLDWQRSHTARPAALQRLIDPRTGDPDLLPGPGFGARGLNTTVTDGRAARSPIEKTLRPVQILTVAGAIPILRVEAEGPTILSGDGFGLAAAAGAGLLADGPPVLYSGALSGANLRTALADPRTSFVVTDSNRRRVWSFTGPLAPASYTLQAGRTLGGRPIGYLLFEDRADTQSTAIYPGLRTIAASGYGPLLGAAPQYRPANAFDGDPSTWWMVGQGQRLTGAWVQATFRAPRTVGSVDLTIPSSPLVRPLRKVRIEFSDGSSTLRPVTPGGVTHVAFPPRTTSFIRFEVAAVGSVVASDVESVAIGDIRIPNLRPAEVIQLPTDLFDTAEAAGIDPTEIGRHELTYLFERSRTGSGRQASEERAVRRRFESPPDSAFVVTGVGALNRTANDDQIDRLVYGPRPVTVTSTSRLFDNPAVRGSAAFDGDPSTSWVPAGTTGESLTLTFPPHTIDRIGIDAAVATPGGAGNARSSILQVAATLSDGSVVRGGPPSPRSGRFTLTFPPVLTGSVTITIERVLDALPGGGSPVAIKEVSIPGVQPLLARASDRLPCETGPGFTVDGSPVGIRPDGTIGDLLTGRSLPFVTCGGEPVRMGGGFHTLDAEGGFVPDRVQLTNGVRPAPAAASAPAVSFRPRSDGGYMVHVSGAAGPYYLVIGQNVEPGWRAFVGGRSLGPPLVLDGYSAGWRIDRPGTYDVLVSYAPQRAYNVALAVTGVAIAAALSVMLLAGWRRLRRIHARPDGDAQAP